MQRVTWDGWRLGNELERLTVWKRKALSFFFFFFPLLPLPPPTLHLPFFFSSSPQKPVSLLFRQFFFSWLLTKPPTKHSSPRLWVFILCKLLPFLSFSLHPPLPFTGTDCNHILMITKKVFLYVVVEFLCNAGVYSHRTVGVQWRLTGLYLFSVSMDIWIDESLTSVRQHTRLKKCLLLDLQSYYKEWSKNIMTPAPGLSWAQSGGCWTWQRPVFIPSFCLFSVTFLCSLLQESDGTALVISLRFHPVTNLPPVLCMCVPVFLKHVQWYECQIHQYSLFSLCMPVCAWACLSPGSHSQSGDTHQDLLISRCFTQKKLSSRTVTGVMRSGWGNSLALLDFSGTWQPIMWLWAEAGPAWTTKTDQRCPRGRGGVRTQVLYISNIF